MDKIVGVMAYTGSMAIQVKRVYNKPARKDGARLLVDRLWPRGVAKREAAITVWEKDFAPSAALRKWFHEDPERRFQEFERKYRGELKKNTPAIRSRLNGYGKEITLVTSVKDIAQSHIPTLKTFLETLRR